MDEISVASTISLCAGVILSIAAVVAILLRQTRGVPTACRPRRMAVLVYSAIVQVFFRRSVAAVVVGFLAFAGILCVGLAATISIIWATSPEYSHPTEANETFGDYVEATITLYCGALVSLPIAAILGFAVGERIASGSAAELKKDVLPTATSDFEASKV